MAASLIEKIARDIADALGDNFDYAFNSKPEWTAARGETKAGFRDVNQPYKPDYLDAAQAALTAIMGEGDGVQEVDKQAAQELWLDWHIGKHNAEELFARHRMAAAAAERARMGWRPIETFPGDHPYWTSDLDRDEPKPRYYEDALVYGPTWGGGWTDPFGCKEDRWTGAARVAIASTYTDKGFWTISPSVQDWEEYIKPTHWMPLLAPPADAIERGEV